MGLERYQTKRDFTKTTEPSGQWGTGEGRRFVVQEHHASRLHWDFRLEMDGVLKSWAVPKGPPAADGDKRLAIQVEDHPVDYIDFTGTIPAGEYGAGEVLLWDRGTYTLLNQGESVLELVLCGEKLHGRYSLVHPKTFQADHWLFIKHGN